MNRDQIMIYVFIALTACIFFYFRNTQENSRLEAAVKPIKESIAASHRPRVITFTAKWCGACQQFKPILNKVMANYVQSIDCQIIDVDNKAYAKMTRDFGVSSIPATFIFDRSGNLIHKQVGLIEPEDLDEYLRKTVI